MIYQGYNKISAKAIYNCPDCFAKKEQTKPYNKPRSENKSQDSPNK
ncbi:MAG: hypothetical protein HY211_04795 [Candidatus Omnitrophica bacterium]|nr:hypothetical protein [Candidatus Omnitrophota bacterium]